MRNTLRELLEGLAVFTAIVALAIFSAYEAAQTAGLPSWAALVFIACFIFSVVGYSRAGNAWGLGIWMGLTLLPVLALPLVKDGTPPEAVALVGMLMGYAALVVVPVLVSLYVAATLPRLEPEKRRR